MSKKWTEAYPRDNAIVDYKQFNKGYNAYKSTFNGGIDRTITPSEVIDEDALQTRAFHKMLLFRRGDVTQLADATTVTDDFRGPTYNTYGGGWITADSFNIDGMKNGMLHWEFSSHIYNYTYYSGDNPKYCTIRLMFDGVEVAHAYKIPAPTVTFRLVCDVPVTASPNTVSVQVRDAAYNDGDGTRCLFQLLSMQHLFIGRWR
tara:strand:- start:290 stop:898 length:609 start_codon:yes stop_codon:yes gene_type:complete